MVALNGGVITKELLNLLMGSLRLVKVVRIPCDKRKKEDIIMLLIY